MDQHRLESVQEELARAYETIAQQKDVVERLQQQLEREQFAQELRQLMVRSSTASQLLSPFTHSRLLEMVVQTAAEVISADAGSLFLIDEEAQELVFEVAIGPKARQVKQFHVPLGHGIAGLVAVSGQPMAIAHADQDTRLALDIAFSIQYVPKSILCVPLFYNDRVIGVIELLDKQKNALFTPEDMYILGLFSHMAAVAIGQSRSYHDQQSLLQSLIHAFTQDNVQQRQQLYQQAESFSHWVTTEDPSYARMRELVTLVNELSLYGEQEAALCSTVLQGFAQSLRLRNLAVLPS
ncbi:GAF domain-containing protein [Tengunoibacter tsumagoiensis]|uniref:GAF domain-containing protein n=1 Tax=Tengunoibacter tsumagoiensis TaxID=2014871 RepID=A0A402A6N6_9CHLR|nr:GAF domain-containing protein [Tengunoibacter tsumagoiensis]GCE14651.1 hypothetical protein KTT_45100 [Tengunoibacter tsumagoiensis]